MVSAARALAVQRQAPLLYDFRRLQLPRQTPLALVVRFPALAGLPGPLASLRSAAIVAAEQWGHEVWDAYRLASRQGGMHWNYFVGEAEALQWLLERNHWHFRRRPQQP